MPIETILTGDFLPNALHTFEYFVDGKQNS